MRDKRIVNPKRVISDLKDPRGWTLENNPFPCDVVDDPLDESDWRNWFEWEDGCIKPSACHSCISRAKIGSGNCRDGGEYFICLPEDVRTGKVPYKKPIKYVQSTLM